MCWNRKQPTQISHRKKCAKIKSNKNENENKLISLEPVHAFIPDNQNITKYNIINREKKTKHRNNRNPIIIKCYFLNETHWNSFFSRFMNFHKRINNINFDFNMTLSPECGHELAPIFGSNMDNSIYTETKQKPAEHFFGDHRQAFTQTIHSNANHDPTIEQLLSKISTIHDHPMGVCFFSFKEFKHIGAFLLYSAKMKQSLEYMGMILTTFQIIWPNWRYRFNKNKQKNYKNNHIILQLLPIFLYHIIT